MKLFKVCAASLLILFAVNLLSCKKDSGETLLPIYQPDAYFFDSVSGAMYAISATEIRKDSLGNFDSSFKHIARAWFGSKNSTQATGYVVANYDTLIPTPLGGDPYNATWYVSKPDNNLNFHYFSNILWQVKEDSAGGIPHIMFIDDRPFPYLKDLDVPDSLSISSGKGLDVKFKFDNYGPNDQLLLQVSGSLGKTGWATDVASTKEKLTMADLSRIAKPGDSIKVTMVPIKVVTIQYAQKPFAFIKEAPVSRFCLLY